MSAEKYNLTIGDSFEMEMTAGAAEALDFVTAADGRLHLLHHGKSFHAEVIATDFAAKQVHLRLNGVPYHITIGDRYDALIKKMGLSASIVHKIRDVKAPMPGLVLSIEVQPGQEVAQGVPLVILEAMKMENTIKSPGEGRVKNIRVQRGQAVEKGEILIEME